MSRLPAASSCRIDDAKIRDYLLNPSNVQNRGKVQKFGQYGFTRTDWHILAAALRAHGLTNEVAQTSSSVHGIKYVVRCNLTTPDQKNPCLTSVWIIETGQITPRLVTAY